jgi:hypothetical protein
MVVPVFMNRICMQPMRWLNIHLGVWGSTFVTLVFLSCSQSVLNDIPHILNMYFYGVPYSTSLYPIFFDQSSPLLTYICEPNWRHSILTLKTAILGGAHKFQFVFFLVMGLCKKREAHLINRGEVNSRGH